MKAEIDRQPNDDHFEMILDGVAADRRFEDLIVNVPAEKRAEVSAQWETHRRHVSLLRKPKARRSCRPLLAGPEYRITEELGVGGMGTVFAAQRASDSTSVAVKVLHAHLAASVRWRSRFRREFEALKKLDHPHIVKVYDWIEADGVSGFAMQRIFGKSLAESVPLAADQVLRIGKEIAEALAHAHDKGVLHRDIKPQNILIDRAGHAFVGDFGLARITDESSLTPTGDILASLAYASPEQILAGRTSIDARTDIYSLGATLFEALTGEPPYGSKSPTELVAAIAFGEVPDPTTRNPQLARGIGDIVRRTLAKNPDDRYPNARALSDDLERMMRGEAPEASQRVLTKRRVSPRIVVALLLLAAALVAFYFVGPKVGSSANDANLDVSAAGFGSGPREASRGVTAHGLITYSHPMISPELRIAEIDEFSDEIIDVIVLPSIDGELLRSRSEVAVDLAPGRYRAVMIGRDGEIELEYDFDVIDAEAPFRVDIPECGQLAPKPVARIDAGQIEIEHHSFRDKTARRKTAIVGAFLIDLLLVSNRDYLDYCRSTKRATPDHWNAERTFVEKLPSEEWLDLPATKISYDEARDFAAWRGMRLPTRAEWLLAARGRDLRRFPWGNDADEFWARVPIVREKTEGNALADYDTYRRHVRSVTIDPFPSPDGLLNLLGNVWQWTSSPPATTEADGRWRALRDARYMMGFAWNSVDQMPHLAGLDGRGFSERQAHDLTNGFRCARSIDLPRLIPPESPK